MKRASAFNSLVQKKRFDPYLRKLDNFARLLHENWDFYEWPLVIGIGILSLLLGTLGFREYNQQLQVSCTIWDCLYQSLQLFSIQGAFERDVPLPFLLQVTRFLSPAIAAYTFFQALKAIFQEQGLLIQLGQMQNHYIICGLGQKGMLLAKELKQNHKQVVVIERDGANSLLKACKELGVLIVNGDACDRKTLEKAGLRRAKHLVAVCGEDSTNAEIAEQVRAMAQRNQVKGLTCTVHIVDTYLWTLFREREFTIEHNASVTLDFFNVYDTGARILLRETMSYDVLAHAQPHLLIVGMGDLGEYIIIHAAQRWCLCQEAVTRKLHVSIVDPDIDHKLDVLRLKIPLIDHICEFTSYAIKTDGSEFRNALQIDHKGAGAPVTHAYVCMDEISTGLQTGFTLLRLFQSQKVNILVRMSEDTGLTSFLREVKGPDHVSANLKAFGLLDRTCKVGLFDDGTHESLARAIHEAYLEREQSRGLVASDNANLVPWEELSEEARESNRYQANHIGVKLNAIHCGFMLWQDFGAEKFAFTNEEIEIMAEMEHERWRQEKLALGWQLSERRDDEEKLHPDLVHWNDGLSSASREKTRQSVKLIPHLLARAGFQIYRLKRSSLD